MSSLPDTSVSPSVIESRWAGSWARAPRIVAESLVGVANPLLTGLAAGPCASGAEVARALVRSLTPPEADACPPPWLLPGQVRSFRRALAALERYGGALLADPVGSGKTYVALAIAAAMERRPPTACLVPAALAAQWRAVAARLGVPVLIGSHQQASRGRLPTGTGGLVIIDESHHFRNPLTRRYGRAAPWLLGRPVLLLSATPVVNRMADLSHQLLLGVRDDALLADGVVSLRAALAAGADASLGHLVIEEPVYAGPRPGRSSLVSSPTAEEDAAAARALARLARLELSRHPPTAALVRGVLQRAVASSPAALAGALRRYRKLLLHARDACRTGRALSRAELRAFVGELDDQIVLWELCAETGGGIELALDDLDALDGMVEEATAAAAAVDAKAERLRALVADGRPTLIFVTRRETVRHLRDRLGPPAVAWCTGERAGLGPAPAPRAAVLDWFREGAAPPRCLVVTDVAAEGLDLRRAARVVHYDLPWTPMRLEQREGRAVRLGSTHELIEVVRFLPPPALDAALGLNERLERKAALPARAGLGAGGARLWRWRSELADRLGQGPELRGTAVVRGGAATGLLAGFELLARGAGRVEILAATLGWLDSSGRWSEDEATVATRVLEAARCGHPGLAPARVRVALDRLASPIRERLALTNARRWTAGDPDPSARRLAARLAESIREAARMRDERALTRLERALAFTAGGHTAGEAMLVRRLADASDGELASWTARLPAPTPRWDAIEVRLTGLVLFER
jgi:superfamily II DNA or RNA helicase